MLLAAGGVWGAIVSVEFVLNSNRNTRVLKALSSLEPLEWWSLLQVGTWTFVSWTFDAKLLVCFRFDASFETVLHSGCSSLLLVRWRCAMRTPLKVDVSERSWRLFPVNEEEIPLAHKFTFSFQSVGRRRQSEDQQNIVNEQTESVLSRVFALPQNWELHHNNFGFLLWVIARCNVLIYTWVFIGHFSVQ